MLVNEKIFYLLGGIVTLLSAASLIGYALSKRSDNQKTRETIDNLNARTKSWWVMVAIFTFALLTGKTSTLILFCITSFLAFREFITLTPTHRGDHRALFLSFFILIPLQYTLIGFSFYGIFSILIPVYGFILLSARTAAAGDCDNYLKRISVIQWGLLTSVYCLSHAPALLLLEIGGYTDPPAFLLFFLITVVQLSDVLQYVFGKLFGKRPIAPTVSPNKTLEGFVGGTISASLIGGLLWWITPFTIPIAMLMAFLICIFGFFGGLVMSAIKRDRGVKDYGSMIQGHGGVFDRIDSICFSAPLFFHLTRYFYT